MLASASNMDTLAPPSEVFDAQLQTPVGFVVQGRLAPTQFPTVTVASCTKIGKRKKQEDRCTIVPRVLGRDDVYFFGVFDGTVGDLAAAFVNTELPQKMLGAQAFHSALSTARPVGTPHAFGSAPGTTSFVGTPTHAPQPGVQGDGPAHLLRTAVEDAFVFADVALLQICREQAADYASCTAVTAVLAGDLLTLAHLGDSKIVLGREKMVEQPGLGGLEVLAERLSVSSGGSAGPSTTTTGGYGSGGVHPFSSHPTSPTAGPSREAAGSGGYSKEGAVPPPSSTAHWGSMNLNGVYLTFDHKPDQAGERRRIEASGGSLAYLHGGKPFIRGGDFTPRQQRGDRPMQLNYSRAFGGKDLKPYGLLAVPDVTQVALTPADRLLILASDGLWDVCSADTAVRRAAASIAAGRDASLDLTDYALAQHDIRGSIDNVTVIVVQLNNGRTQ